MTETRGSLADIVGDSIVGVISCLFIGFVFHGWQIFNSANPAFEFLIAGVLGSLFFFTLKVRVRDAFALLVVLFFLNSSLITKSFASSFFFRDLLFFAAVSCSVYVYFVYFYRSKKQERRIGPLILSTLFSLSFLVALILLHGIHGVPFSTEDIRFVIIPVVKDGFLIGLGIGIGILIVDAGLLAKIREQVVSFIPRGKS
jgi:hypothetical protein